MGLSEDNEDTWIWDEHMEFFCEIFFLTYWVVFNSVCIVYIEALSLKASMCSYRVKIQTVNTYGRSLWSQPFEFDTFGGIFTKYIFQYIYDTFGGNFTKIIFQYIHTFGGKHYKMYISIHLWYIFIHLEVTLQNVYFNIFKLIMPTAAKILTRSTYYHTLYIWKYISKLFQFKLRSRARSSLPPKPPATPPPSSFNCSPSSSSSSTTTTSLTPPHRPGCFCDWAWLNSTCDC